MKVKVPRSEDYFVIRYNTDTPMVYRKHQLTVGRYPSHASASLGVSLIAEVHPQCALEMHIEERTHTWEEEVEMVEVGHSMTTEGTEQ
jgi:hypothetical protein